MSSREFPIPKPQIGHLLLEEANKYGKNKRRFFDDFRKKTVDQQVLFKVSLREKDERIERQSFYQNQGFVEQLDRDIASLIEMMQNLSLNSDEDTDELVKLQNLLKELLAQKFVSELSACMSIATQRSCMILHRTADLSSKHMLKSSSRFEVTHDGEISRGKKKSELSDLDQIIEVSEDDSEDDFVDSVDSEEE